MRVFCEWGYFNLENLEFLELLENRTTHTDPSSLRLRAVFGADEGKIGTPDFVFPRARGRSHCLMRLIGFLDVLGYLEYFNSDALNREEESRFNRARGPKKEGVAVLRGI